MFLGRRFDPDQMLGNGAATPDVLRLVQSGWPQVLAIFAIIWWSRKIDLRTLDHREGVERLNARLDRQEQRLAAQEQTHQAQALQLVRIEEAMAGIKLTLDRIYTEVREKS